MIVCILYTERENEMKSKQLDNRAGNKTGVKESNECMHAVSLCSDKQENRNEL